MPISSHTIDTNDKLSFLYKVAEVSLLPADTSYMLRMQPDEVLSLQFIWSSEIKIKTYPYVIILYLVIGTSCAIPSVGISFLSCKLKFL